jgi:hypothetical protein
MPQQVMLQLSCKLHLGPSHLQEQYQGSTPAPSMHRLANKATKLICVPAEHGDHAMGCHNEDVALVWVQVCCLDELSWEVLSAVLPPAQPAGTRQQTAQQPLERDMHMVGPLFIEGTAAATIVWSHACQQLSPSAAHTIYAAAC